MTLEERFLLINREVSQSSISLSDPEIVKLIVRGLGDGAQVDKPIGPLTTFRVGGNARIFFELDSEHSLERLFEVLNSYLVPILVIGNGSNLLVSDSGFDGLAIHLSGKFSEVSGFDSSENAQYFDNQARGPERIVLCGAGLAMPVVARKTVARSLTGFEWAVGVPGTLGGGVAMNAGGHGSQISDCLEKATIVSLDATSDNFALLRQVFAAEMDFSYRHSCVQSSDLVLWASLKLAKASRSDSEKKLSEIVAWRRENQPGGHNCGSVFTNPQTPMAELGSDMINQAPQTPMAELGDDTIYSAGALIEMAGLKGFSVGQASVSTKHANFIQADPGCSAQNVYDLILTIQERVEMRFGVRLKLEVKILGFDNDAV